MNALKTAELRDLEQPSPLAGWLDLYVIIYSKRSRCLCVLPKRHH